MTTIIQPQHNHIDSLYARKPEVEKKGRKKKTPEKPKAPGDYKPGETWQTSSGSHGGKNSKKQIRYFRTQKAAQTFASK